MREISAVPDIESPRLLLRWFSPVFMQASLDGDLAAAERELGASIPEGWPEAHAGRSLARRLDQMTREPDSAAWLLRGMVRREDGALVGYINFHAPPDERGRAELGYTVLEPYRRRGYATEAARAMMDWAMSISPIEAFVVSVSPLNQPSLAMAAVLGFQRIGSQIDEEDGEEWVFELVPA